jgi:NAD+ kinase
MKIHFHASDNPRPQAALLELGEHYENTPVDQADVIVVLGGDGAMLRALHNFTGVNLPLFGLNLGTLGFLLNEYKSKSLQARIENAKAYDIHPLRMKVTEVSGETHEALAYNEVSLLRETHSSAKVMVFVNGEVRLPLLVCDGVMVSTPVGSTAYNSSADGPILPLSANVMPITPISAFRPRRWAGALIPDTSEVRFEVIKPKERPVSVSADSFEIRDIACVDISVAQNITSTLLFDPEHHLEERIYQEQFAP